MNLEIIILLWILILCLLSTMVLMCWFGYKMILYKQLANAVQQYSLSNINGRQIWIPEINRLHQKLKIKLLFELA